MKAVKGVEYPMSFGFADCDYYKYHQYKNVSYNKRSFRELDTDLEETILSPH